MSALDLDTAQRLIDLLDNPLENNKYTTLKERLLDTFELSEYERAARLLNMPNLGDRKPSVLMDEKLGLLGQHTPCFLFKYIFLQHLPDDIRTILATETFGNSRSLAQRANTLWMDRGAEPTIARTRQQAAQRTKPAVRFSSNAKKVGLCFYHKRFGNKAHCCVPPSAFERENSQAGRR